MADDCTINNTPGHPCCDGVSCTIYETEFPSSVEFAAEWSIVEGAFSWLAPNHVQATAAAVATADARHPAEPWPAWVRAGVKGASGSKLRVLIGYSGDGTAAGTGYLFAELRPGDACGELYLYRLTSETGGLDLLSGPHSIPGATVDDWHKLTVCYDPDADGDGSGRIQLSAIVETATGVFYQHSVDVPLANVYGDKAGIAAGSSAEHNFRDFQFDRLWYETDDPFGYGGGCDYGYDCERKYCHDCAPPGCYWAFGHFTDEDFYDCEWDDPSDPDEWSIDDVNNWLEADSSGGGLIWHKIERPAWAKAASYNTNSVTATFLATAVGSSLSLYLCGDAAGTSYLRGEVTVGIGNEFFCGQIRLYKSVGGVETEIGQPAIVYGIYASVSYNFGLELCTDGTLRGVLSGGAEDGGASASFVRFSESCDPPCTWNMAVADTDASYTCAGDLVGLSGSTTGEIRVGGFSAGCFIYKDYCEDDRDEFRTSEAPLSGIACRWDQLSGTTPTAVSFLGGEGYEFTDDSTLICKNPVNVEAQHQVVVTFQIEQAEGGDGHEFCAIIAGTETGSSYLYAKAVLGDDPLWTISLWENDAGSHTELTSDDIEALGAQYGEVTLTLCIVGTQLTLNFLHTYLTQTIADRALTFGGVTNFGRYCGFGVTPAASKVAIADNFSIRSDPWNHVGGILGDGQTGSQTDTESSEFCELCELACSDCLNNRVPDNWLLSVPALETWDEDGNDVAGDYYLTTYFLSDCRFTNYFEAGEALCSVTTPAGWQFSLYPNGAVQRRPVGAEYSVPIDNGIYCENPPLDLELGESGRFTLIRLAVLGTNAIGGVGTAMAYWFAKLDENEAAGVQDCFFAGEMTLVFIGTSRPSYPASGDCVPYGTEGANIGYVFGKYVNTAKSLTLEVA